MLQGCVPWPEELARRYIEAGVWEGITVAEMIERTARRQPGKVAVIHGETRITYEELVQSAKRLASGLSSLGLRSQDRVVVQLPNCPEFVVLYLAFNYIGVIPVMARTSSWSANRGRDRRPSCRWLRTSRPMSTFSGGCGPIRRMSPRCSCRAGRHRCRS